MANDLHSARSAGTPAMAWSARPALGLVLARGHPGTTRQGT